MNKRGPIVIVEDDLDDREFLREIINKLNLKNETLMFQDGVAAYEYLNTGIADPFIIISDINMPKMNGLELRDKMQQIGDIRLRTVPFIFLTTAAAKQTTVQAYLNSVQGFFTKSHSLDNFEKTIKKIIDYWEECAEPNLA